jgi:hypothetical protein
MAASLRSYLRDYALTELSDGRGVILNLRTGSYFKVNRAACLVFRVLVDEESSSVGVGEIATKLNVPHETAAQIRDSVLAGLLREAPRHTPSDSFVYDRVTDGLYALKEENRTIFLIDEERHTFSLHESLDRLRAPLVGYVRALLPKLLSLLGLRVIHAGCCRTARGTLAFTGKSGAGKTTTARAFERAGATLISEDLLVLQFSGNSVHICLDAEPLARRWSDRWAASLTAKATQKTDYSVLLNVQSAPTALLNELWFIAADHRQGSSFDLVPIGPLEGLLALMGNGFLGSERADLWRTFLETSGTIAEAVRLTAVRMPDGLAHLQSAAESYMANSAS